MTLQVKRFKRSLPFCIAMLAAVLVSACSSAPVTAVSDYVLFKRQSSIASVAATPIDRSFDYLLVSLNGKSFLMARGAVEKAPSGEIEVWYTGSREVLRMQNGRLISAAGTPVEWSDVSLSAQPAWRSIDGPVQYERRRDVMPGYHFGLEDSVTVWPIATPSRSHYYGKLPGGVRWFSEVSSGPDALPNSRYAVEFDGSHAEVIYGEQCLSKSLCFSWQRWPNRT